MTEAQKTRRSHAERREEAEAKIVEAARDLISEKGTFAVTMSEIGIRAGYSRGLPYQRFGSKEGILEAVLQSFIERFNTRRDNVARPERGLDSITSLIETYFDRDPQDWKNSKALIIIMAEASLHEGRLRDLVVDYNRRHIDYLKKHLAIAQEQGQAASDIDGDSLAVIIMGTLRGVVLQSLSDRKIDLQKAKHQLLEIVLNLLDVPLEYRRGRARRRLSEAGGSAPKAKAPSRRRPQTVDAPG